MRAPREIAFIETGYGQRIRVQVPDGGHGLIVVKTEEEYWSDDGEQLLEVVVTEAVLELELAKRLAVGLYTAVHAADPTGDVT